MSDIGNRYTQHIHSNRNSSENNQKKSSVQSVADYNSYVEKKVNEKIAKATLLRASKLKW
jgi:hypothetical protein